MAENYTPQFVSTFVNDSSAVQTVNANFAAIQTAFLDVLSLSGVSPNQMKSTLDMNSNQIINLPPPATINSPARLIDVASGSITITTATTGTAGHAVPFLDGNNTWSGTNAWSLTSLGTTTGLAITETASGNIPSGYNANSINLNDTGINAGSNSSFALAVNQTFGGSGTQGGRYAISGQTIINSPTNAGNANRVYVGVLGTATVNSSDGGAGLTFGTAAGNFLGGLSQVNVSGAATNLLGVNGLASSIQMNSGSSTWQKTLLSLSSAAGDVSNGAVINAMIECFNEPGTTAKWSQALLIDNAAGSGSFPVGGSGTLIKATAGSVAQGIDFTGMTFSGNAFSSPAFAVSSFGTISTGAFGIVNGNMNFNGITSGFLTLACNNTSTLLTVSQPMQIGVIGTTGGQLTLAGASSGSAVIAASSSGSSLLLNSTVTVASGGGVSTTGNFVLTNSLGAVPAGGAGSNGFFYGSGGLLGVYFGSGAPTVSAAQGSVYVRTDGSSTSTRLYVNTNGSTGWTNFVSAT